MIARTVSIATALLITAGVLAGCAAVAEDSSPPASESPSAGATPTKSADPTPSPTPTRTAVALPDDCREILSEEVLAQLDGIPLNDPGFGPAGVQADGSLICNWADPRADTTRLTTSITGMNRGAALDMLNKLANDERFTCFTPDKGTRCEKTWPNEQYPVTDGRTLFWRDDILIDTRYSNLAPSGYTSSIVARLFD